MSVKIRLRRVGAKKSPSYRVVVADARFPRDGRFIEELGHYNPTTAKPEFSVDKDKAIMWLERGAQPTDTILALFRQEGILKAYEEKKRATRSAGQEKA
ncbi:MAG: 30S ribosomal protein S16 [Bacillota bacterium]|jgi:small subunit ribosomal protein S16|nr:MAG: 30S ribosomal protein S16 [Bacillota bacterium]